jgi:hypothetical protein
MAIHPGKEVEIRFILIPPFCFVYFRLIYKIYRRYFIPCQKLLVIEPRAMKIRGIF